MTDVAPGRPRMTFFFPAFNEEENVTETVRRALAEVGPLVGGSIEVLIVDDGSSDRTPELADALAAADARVRVHHQPNRGYGGALRAGFANATGRAHRLQRRRPPVRPARDVPPPRAARRPGPARSTP